MDSVGLISTVAIAFAVALVLGFFAEKLKFPALVGYLIAGIIVSPNMLWFKLDLNLAEQLSEIGIMLLMFGVGLNFSLSELLRVKKLVVPGAVLQMSLSGLCAFGLSYLCGWDIGNAVFVGMCLCCASTVVVLKALEARGMLESFEGRIAVGWLIIQDMVTVLLLVLLPPLASMLGGTSTGADIPLWRLILETIARVVGFIVLMLVVGKRVLPWLLWQVARTGSRELFTLCVLAVAIGIAFGASQLFNVSFALGAFFAGMVMRESKYAHRAATESLPLRDAFSVIFFVGVGMMFDPHAIVQHPFFLIGLLSVVLIMTPVVASLIVALFGYPLKTALTLGVCLGQIGEFSFILGSLGVSLKVMSPDMMNLVLATAIISIAFNPVMFSLYPLVQKMLVKHLKFARKAAARPDPQSIMPDEVNEKRLKKHVVLVGFGSVGVKLLSSLTKRNVPVVLIDKDDSIVEQLRNDGITAIQGDATDPAVLLQAHVQNASQLVVTLSDELPVMKIVETAKIINPEIECIIRATSDQIAQNMKEEKLGMIVQSSAALASLMSACVAYYLAKDTEKGKVRPEEEGELRGAIKDWLEKEVKDTIIVAKDETDTATAK